MSTKRVLIRLDQILNEIAMEKKIAIIMISSVLLISGCAKKTEESTEYTSDSVAAADAVATDASAEVESAASVSAEGAPQAVANPEQLLMVQQSQLEQNRQLVKSSQISFEVDQLQKATQEIEKKLLEVNGYIELKQIDYQIEDQEYRNKLDGTIDVFEKIKPTAQLTVRVPNAQVSNFLNNLVPIIKNFNQQSYEAKKYELKLLEEKMNTAQQTYGESRALSNQFQQLTQQEVKDRLQYSTISLQYYQVAQVRQSKDLNINRIANIHSDPFLMRIWASIKMGFIAVREVLVWLVMLWPLYLVLLVGFVGYRKFKSKHVKTEE